MRGVILFRNSMLICEFTAQRNKSIRANCWPALLFVGADRHLFKHVCRIDYDETKAGQTDLHLLCANRSNLLDWFMVFSLTYHFQRCY